MVIQKSNLAKCILLCLAAISVVAVLGACQTSSTSSPETSAIPLYLCFDDSTIDNWYDNRDLFDSYDIKVSFYITRFTMLTEDQIAKLHILEDDGHSIQFHSTFHERAAEYLETHTIDEYIENEVYIGLDA